MTKAISVALKNHLLEECTTIATCWRIERADGQIFGYTDHTEDLDISGVLYEASTGYSPTKVETSPKLQVDNLDVMGVISPTAISRDDLLNGVYDGSEVFIFQVNWADLSQGILRLRRGFIGQVEVKRGQFVAEIRGLTQRLQQVYGEQYSAQCRADLGDARCGVTLAGFTQTGTVGTLVDTRTFTSAGLTGGDDWLNHGLLTWTSGDNNGLSMEVKDYVQGSQQVELYLPMPRPIQVGDTFSVYAGCDKQLSTCKNKFNNVVNFRGEPYVPGIDEVAQYAG